MMLAWWKRRALQVQVACRPRGCGWSNDVAEQPALVAAGPAAGSPRAPRTRPSDRLRSSTSSREGTQAGGRSPCTPTTSGWTRSLAIACTPTAELGEVQVRAQPGGVVVDVRVVVADHGAVAEALVVEAATGSGRTAAPGRPPPTWRMILAKSEASSQSARRSRPMFSVIRSFCRLMQAPVARGDAGSGSAPSSRSCLASPMQVSKAPRVSTSSNCSGAPSDSFQLYLVLMMSICGSTVRKKALMTVLASVGRALMPAATPMKLRAGRGRTAKLLQVALDEERPRPGIRLAARRAVAPARPRAAAAWRRAAGGGQRRWAAACGRGPARGLRWRGRGVGRGGRPPAAGAGCGRRWPGAGAGGAAAAGGLAAGAATAGASLTAMRTPPPTRSAPEPDHRAIDQARSAAPPSADSAIGGRSAAPSSTQRAGREATRR